MSDVTNLSDTIVPKSDQLNSEQLLAGPMTITVTAVRRGEPDQPVVVNYQGDNGRPYKPCKSMRKVMIFAWGEDGTQWIGRSLTVFNNPDVMFGGVKVGGIRISHMSHIERDISLSLTATKGKKAQHIIKRLDVADPIKLTRADLEVAARSGMDALKAAWGAVPKAVQVAIGGKAGCPADLKAAAQQADEQRARDEAAQQAQQPQAEPEAPADDEGGVF